MLSAWDIVGILLAILLFCLLYPLPWYIMMDYLHPFFTKQIIDITRQNEPSRRTRYLTYHITIMAFILFYMLRTCYALLAYFDESTFPVSQIDVYVRIMLSIYSGPVGYLGLISIVMFYAFCLASEYLIYISLPPGPFVWQKYQDLILRNYLTYRVSRLSQKEKTEIYSKSLKQMQQNLEEIRGILYYLPAPVLNAYCAVYCHAQNYFTGQYINLNQFQQCQLRLLAKVSLKLRIKFAFLVDVLELGAIVFEWTIILCLHVTLPISGWIYMFRVPMWSYPLLILDAVLFAYVAMGIAFTIIFMIDITVLNNVHYKGHGREITTRLKHLKQALELTDRLELHWFARVQLLTFLREHILMCKLLLMNNRQYLGTFIFIALLANLPSNVYVLYSLVHDGSSTQESFYRYLHIGFFALQVSGILLAIVPFGNVAREMHSAHRIVPGLMYHLDSRRVPIQLKWAYLLLHERLTTGPKYGISIGTISIITNRIILEIGILYVGMLINLFALTRHRY